MLVEQHVGIALAFADRAILLDKGAVVFDGPADTLKRDTQKLHRHVGVKFQSDLEARTDHARLKNGGHHCEVIDMLTLYDFGNSVCCQKVRITMVEKDLTWDAVQVDLFKTSSTTRSISNSIPRAWCDSVHDGEPVMDRRSICEIHR